MKVSVWDKILKVIIAVASAIAGVIGGQVMAI
ncbi:MAG TPA: smalltalk protein [Bacteroides clarus]|nr:MULTISPECIES: smalltalk protein [Bacteroides]MCQ1545880.1 smalltalk protein [Bacteroides clarus]HJF99400.1 smalltalk protein [Bacteroides clarus]